MGSIFIGIIVLVCIQKIIHFLVPEFFFKIIRYLLLTAGFGLYLFFSGAGFYLIYQAGEMTYEKIYWKIYAIETNGTVVKADNHSNMSSAVIEFNDSLNNIQEIKYTASYNGTYFSVGQKIPLRYFPENPKKVNVIEGNSKISQFVLSILPIFLMLLLGLPIAIFFILLFRNVIYLSIYEYFLLKQLPRIGIVTNVKLSRATYKYNDCLLTLKDINNQFYEIKLNKHKKYDIDSMKNANLTLLIHPKDKNIYALHKDSLDIYRSIR